MKLDIVKEMAAGTTKRANRAEGVTRHDVDENSRHCVATGSGQTAKYDSLFLTGCNCIYVK